MKKVNKTLLLASTLFISTALAGGSKVYADDFNTLDKQKMADALDASQEKTKNLLIFKKILVKQWKQPLKKNLLAS